MTDDFVSKDMFGDYVKHNESMRIMEEKLQIERDRRYSEVAVEREKALRIKETADLAALELARESQTYKDERNDSIREQNIKETGIYATRDDITMVLEKMDKALKPLVDFVSSQQGVSQGVTDNTNKFRLNTSTVISIITVAVLLIAYFK